MRTNARRAAPQLTLHRERAGARQEALLLFCCGVNSSRLTPEIALQSASERFRAPTAHNSLARCHTGTLPNLQRFSSRTDLADCS
jgi:hypothetical protein